MSDELSFDKFLSDLVREGGSKPEWHLVPVLITRRDIDNSEYSSETDSWRLLVHCLDERVSMILKFVQTSGQDEDGPYHSLELIMFMGNGADEHVERTDLCLGDGAFYYHYDFVMLTWQADIVKNFFSNWVPTVLRRILDQRINGQVSLGVDNHVRNELVRLTGNGLETLQDYLAVTAYQRDGRILSMNGKMLIGHRDRFATQIPDMNEVMEA